MSDEGKRIEFGGPGPYLLQVLECQPQAMLLEEHAVCLLQFEQLYLPVSIPACKDMADGLSNMSQAAMGPEREGMTPVEFDLSEVTELPLVTGAASESFQHDDMVYMDVMFGDTAARLCLSILAAAVVGQSLSQVPAE